MIPISQPSIGPREIELVTEAISSGWISSIGKFIEAFEHGFADFCGVRHCVAVANGTVGLHLALATLDIGLGDEVLVPDLTFVATANAVRMTGATPVFVDALPDSWCMNPKDCLAKLTPRTRAIVPVHLYGHPAAMDEIMEIARAHALRVIEDAAEAHGALYRDRRVGTIGDLGVFSFYGNKILTTGEGGAIVTSSEDLANRAAHLRDHAMSKERRYWHTETGYNYRMTNLQAAVGVAQLTQVGDFLARRREILDVYRHYLAPNGLDLNPTVGDVTPVNWMTSIVINGIAREARDEVIRILRESGVDTRPFFFPVSEFPMYRTTSGVVSSALSKSGLNLPTFIGLRDEDIAHVSRSLLAALDEVAY